ncbi:MULTISPECIES: hypothetical protein [unclassified Roseitalea]|uniref:hypothetical protein n=1 Tax=unclassified Roseitalea TaxID=2639107 RepID=UPI00273F9132|nr:MULTISPECIES: hypothetical protein [unclassified Roseitalea]
MSLLAFSELVRNAALAVVALVGTYLAWKRVFAANRQAEASTRQAELARRDFVAELFNRAVGQLGDERLEVRLGAVYILQQIAEDFPDLAGPVYRLLAAYLRETEADYRDDDSPLDVKEIMEFVQGWLRPDENDRHI